MDKSNHKQSSKRMLGMKHANHRVQAERSENRIRPAKHASRRARPTPIPNRDNPNLQAVVMSPGWREMSLSARVIAMTLLALARMDVNNSVTIDRKGLSDLTGITDPNTLAKANRELQAIGLFEIDRGYRTKYAERPTVYRLTWWSQVFQRWLSAGYAVPETSIPHLPPTPPHHTRVRVLVVGFSYQRSQRRGLCRKPVTTSRMHGARPIQIISSRRHRRYKP